MKDYKQKEIRKVVAFLISPTQTKKERITCMKNINQLQTEIKAAGLSGLAAELELRDRLLRQAEQTVLSVVNSPNDNNSNPDNLAIDLAQLLEIFAFSDGDFDRRDFAVDLQEFLFRQTHRYDVSYELWCQEVFADEPVVFEEWSDIISDGSKEAGDER